MRREYYLIRVGILLAVAIGLMSTPAWALVEHPNTTDYPNSEELPVMSDRPADAVVGWWSSNASAVAIGSNYIITTCHQGGGVGTTVSFGGVAYKVAEVFQHSKADLRIARITTLDGQAANLTNFADYNISQSESTKTAVIGGFGFGRGSITPDYYTWDWTDNKTERWGQNYVEYTISISDPASYSSQLLVARFDNYGAGNWVNYEACVAKYDSGGGWFLKDTDTGQWMLAGLSRGVTHAAVGQAWFQAGGGESPDLMDSVRLSSYTAWLDNALSRSTWNSTSGGTWSDGTKWSGGAPNAADKFAVFSDTASGSRTVTLSSNAQLGTLRFDCLGDVTIDATGSNRLEFNVSYSSLGSFAWDMGILETSNTNGNGTLTIAAPVRMTAPLMVRQNSSGLLTISGVISDPASSKALTKTGTGTLVLSGTNTYKGGTTINQGMLRVTNASGLGSTSSSFVTLVAGATLDVQSDSALTLNNRVKVTSNQASPALTTAYFNVDRATAGPARTMTFGGTLTTDGAVTLSTTSATGCSAAFSGLANITNLGTTGVATLNTAGADLALTGGLTLASGTLTKSGPKALTVSGTQTYGAETTLRVNDGTLTLNNDAGSASAYNLSLVSSNATTVNLGSSQHLAALSLGGTSRVVLPGGTGTVVTKALDIAGGASPTPVLDLKDGRLAVDYTGGSPVAAVASWIKGAYNTGLWDGAGITSQLLKNNPLGNYGIGYVENAELPAPFGASRPFGDYAGADGTTVLVRYTFIGDVNLDGIVNDVDISIVTNNYGRSGMNWLEGDVFGYDGIVDDSDVGLTVNNYGMPSGGLLGSAVPPLSADSALSDAAYGGASALTAVPEPMTALLLGAGVLALAAHRRRH